MAVAPLDRIVLARSSLVFMASSDSHNVIEVIFPAVLRSGPLAVSISGYGRGERACTSHTHLSVDLIRLVPDRAVTVRSAG